MPQPANKLESALRVTRMIATFMLAYIPIIALVIERLQLSPGTVDRTFFTGICGASLASIAVGFFLRRKFVENTAEALRLNSEDAAALGRWRAGQIISSAFAVSIALYGVSLRMLGAPLAQATPFYALSVALMILWWPQAP
jgi:hypothetical protein